MKTFLIALMALGFSLSAQAATGKSCEDCCKGKCEECCKGDCKSCCK